MQKPDIEPREFILDYHKYVEVKGERGHEQQFESFYMITKRMVLSQKAGGPPKEL